MTLPFKAVAVDMDGTFLDDRKQFNHKEFDQILTEFEQRGVHFIVASGRPYVRLKQDFGKFASRMDFVTLNGSRLIIKGQEAGSYLLNRDDVLKLIHDVHVKYGEMATMVFGRDIAYLHSNVEKDECLTIRDYMVRIKDKDEQEQLDEYMQRLARFDNEQLLDLDLLARTLNLNEYHEKDKRVVLEPRGYRILNKIARLPYTVIENMVAAFGTLQSIVLASNEELDAVEGIGPARVAQITLGLERIRSQILTDSNWVK